MENNLDYKLIEEYKISSNLALLGELYKPYMPLVYGIALKYLKDQEKGKDAVMQIFEELVLKLKSHDVKNFKSWLYVVSRNHCLMQLRKEQKNITVAISDEIVESEPFLHHDDVHERELKLIAMEECLKTLTAEQQLSVDLFYLKQKCYLEVAEITGYELKKVKSYIQNGKRNLKICIEKTSE